MKKLPSRVTVRDDDRYSYFSPAEGVWVVWDRQRHEQAGSYGQELDAIGRWQQLMGIPAC